VDLLFLAIVLWCCAISSSLVVFLMVISMICAIDYYIGLCSHVVTLSSYKSVDYLISIYPTIADQETQRGISIMNVSEPVANLTESPSSRTPRTQ